MATREIIEIDEAKCDGCGACETGCPEGALRIIDGKARLVGESLCDGLGACIGNCPRGAITVTRREAEAYDEAKVMEGIIAFGPKVIAAHLAHLEHHGQDGYVRQAKDYLAAKGLPLPASEEPSQAPAAAARNLQGAAGLKARPATATGCASPSGCPGSASRRFGPTQAARAFVMPETQSAPQAASSPSALSHWPIQLHLINPRAPQYAGADLLIAADCTAFSLGGFHGSLLAGKSLVIACPKLDQGRDIYLDKFAALLQAARSVTVAIMEVPCCSGLLKLVLEARERLEAQPPVQTLVISVEGEIKDSRGF